MFFGEQAQTMKNAAVTAARVKNRIGTPTILCCRERAVFPKPRSWLRRLNSRTLETEAVMDEIRLAWRRLRHRPAAGVISVLTLACAIGAAAATWSLLSATLIRPLPVKDADRLVVAGRRETGLFAGRLSEGFIYTDFPKMRDSGTFEAVAAEWSTAEVLGTRTGAGTAPVSTRVGFATFNYFDLLGIPVRLGRGFQPTDDRRGAAPVAILTNDYCRREFDGCSDALGRTLTVAGKTATIVGVAGPGFQGTSLSSTIDFYLPFHTIADVGSPWMNYLADPSHQMSPTAGTKIIARLRPGSRLRTIDGVELTPIQEAAVPAISRVSVTQFARLLAATVALLLLIGCCTVGMLLLVRTEARRDEFSLCSALGASRVRLAAGIAIEGVLLSCAGGALALPVASWLFTGAQTFQLPGGLAIARLGLGVDLAAVAAASIGALGAGVIVSIIAGAFGFSADSADSLRSRAGATPRLRRRASRSTLVAAQVAVALVLAAGATLFARSLAAALDLNTGLDMNRIISSSLSLGSYGYDNARANQFFEALGARLRGNPFVASFGYAVQDSGMMGPMVVDGQSHQFASQVRFTAVDSDYLRAMGLHLVAGRDFTPSDRQGAPLVTIVSESLARQLAHDGGALGRRIAMPFSRPPQGPDVMQVVGVVSDVITNVSELEPVTMYFPLAQTETGTSRAFIVRAAKDTDSARREILTAIKDIDGAVLPASLPTLADRIAMQMGVQRFGAAVLGSLGAIAVLLTILGSYVLAESMAVLRMREMGIRAALGATRRQLGAIVLAETGRLVGVGLVAGFVLAWVGAGTIRAFLFQVRPLDPSTLVGVAGAILVFATLVSLRPAIRAAHVDLAQVLKEQ